jgi:hypothetical protein
MLIKGRYQGSPVVDNSVVGDTGFEPVTPTVRMFREERKKIGLIHRFSLPLFMQNLIFLFLPVMSHLWLSLPQDSHNHGHNLSGSSDA